MKKLTIIICTICVICGSFSCSDMLESDSTRQVFDPALDQKTDSIFYALGILQGMQELADHYAFQGEMRGDLVETTTFTDNNLRQLANFSATTANKYDSAYVYYRVINNCNYYIAHRDTTLLTGANPVAMNEYVAVLAIRAWTYMQLARVYGRVPFYTTPLTQISQIDKGNFPELDMKGIVAALAPQLEKYTGYVTPRFGDVSPASGIVAAYLFMPVDVVMGDMYLETEQFDKAAKHYITYLTKVARSGRFNTAYMQIFSYGSGRRAVSLMDKLPSDFSIATAAYGRNSTTWMNVFSGTDDVITYIPMAQNSMLGAITNIPLAYGYDYYSTSPGYLDDIQVIPSQAYTQLSDSTDFYYISTESENGTIIHQSKLGDTRYSVSTREDSDDETNETTTWVVKNRYARVLLYRVTTVWLHLAEAFNRLGMYDAAFAILKDGISAEMLESALYLSDETKTALQTTYPLLSDENIIRFTAKGESGNKQAPFGVHMHGAGVTCDWDASSNQYIPELSPYQMDTIVGLKLKEVEATFGATVGTTKQDSINAVEDIICDEYALEFAFEGSRFYDLARIARHKNNDATYGTNFGGKWLARKLAAKNAVVNLQDEKNWYLPFK